MSPRITLLYQTEAHLLISTSPTKAIKVGEALTKGGIGCDPAIFSARFQVVKGQLHSVLGVLLGIGDSLVSGGRDSPGYHLPYLR